ncbi:multicopper oxidase domain-containing protein [Albibacterium bauzanense]|uniref:CopA family copper-resistance protein n=1 Tax=Albibacterium bauzanense TaxID=653929 RepID=A0A4R1LW54_9SPHI|nr:multicopper oxidase domain-containing protein [Albibacterium bauzanense]TCK83658.1 CopA family copper-resistance protein [Albibacterium bauzanense]
MKKIVLYILLMSTYGFAQAQHEGHTAPAQKKAPSVVYTCPMHPEVQSTGPGNCPKCGMKLVVQKKKSVQPKNAAPVKKNPPAKMDGMEDMKMPPQKQATDKPAQSLTYTCPMHPEIHAAKPGNCPKCGMKLVKEAPRTAPAKHDGMDMPMKEDAKKTDNMEDMKGMQMGDDNATMENIKKAKAQLGQIKTISSNTPPRTVRYDLYIADTTVTYGKKSKRAIAVNGQIPMPTLTFTEGDTALIYVHNNLDEETSLHWHGLFLPNKMDGVPFLTQMPIKPHSTYIYKFPIVQHGTHWYHSHSKLQEQIGMYGAFIMNKRKEWDIPTIPVVLSEWTDMKPEEVHRSLKNATDWFAIQKGAAQSYAEAIKTGHFKTKVNNEWKRMTAMDVSDVYYDAFLINGKNQNEQPQFKAGDKVRLRIANAGASDYFWLTYSGGKITVVATDGNDVEPVEVDRLIIAVSETYDVVVTIPDNKSYEFLVTPEDRTKSASLWLGKGEKVPAKKLPKLKYFAGMKMMNDMMDMQGNMIEMEGMNMQNQIMDMNTVMYPEITGAENAKADNKKADMPGMQMPNDQSMSSMNMAEDNPDIVTLNYNMLRDPKKTTLPKGPWKELKFDLTGNMNRYVWTLDNKTVSESDKILIKKGENVRIIMFNNSMMRHPMHLHGHDFRVLNEQGENAPMKNVLDIMPMERDTIEFAATEQGGDWFFHCHILYHMMSGMGRVFSYQDTLIDKTDITDTKVAKRGLNSDDRAYHPMATIGLESNGSDGEFMMANTRYRFSTEWRLGLKAHHGNESETYFGRYIGRMQWLFPFIGFDYHYNSMNNERENNLFGQVSNQKNRKAAVIGVQYILPMLVTAEARLDSKGKLRFQLMREDIPLTSRLRMNFMANTDKEYMAGFRYIVTKYFSLSTHYDSDMGYGGGITITY